MNLLICLPLFLSYAVPSSCGLMTTLDKSEEIPKSTVEVLSSDCRAVKVCKRFNFTFSDQFSVSSSLKFIAFSDSS